MENTIQDLRKKSGLTQIELSKQLKVTVKTLREWEKGKKPDLDIESVNRIQTVFNVELEKVLTLFPYYRNCI